MKNTIIDFSGLITLGILALILAVTLVVWRDGYRQGQKDAFNGKQMYTIKTNVVLTIK